MRRRGRGRGSGRNGIGEDARVRVVGETAFDGSRGKEKGFSLYERPIYCGAVWRPALRSLLLDLKTGVTYSQSVQ